MPGNGISYPPGWGCNRVGLRDGKGEVPKVAIDGCTVGRLASPDGFEADLLAQPGLIGQPSPDGSADSGLGQEEAAPMPSIPY